MKILLAILATYGMSASAATACPDLSGNYLCADDSGQYTQAATISQKDVNGATMYLIGTSPLALADGKAYPIATEADASGISFKGSQTTTCDATSVNTHTTGDYSQNTAVVAHQDTVQTLALDAAKNITITAKGKITEGTQSEDINQSGLCKRAP